MISLLLLGSLALSGIGGTMATWSDSETSQGNYIETGSVDLLVAKCDTEWANAGAFKDDLPYGVGLDPCFAAMLVPGANYTCYSLLWNGGCVDAEAYLHLKNASGSNSLSSHTIMNIWYDDDGNPDNPLVLVASDTISNLDCHEISLGGLPAQAVRQLKLVVKLPGGCPSGSLQFDIVFELAAGGFADSEVSENYFSLTA
jgi:predicted ribosomally synthesized peptide with SipW-like signal peptide